MLSIHNILNMLLWVFLLIVKRVSELQDIAGTGTSVWLILSFNYIKQLALANGSWQWRVSGVNQFKKSPSFVP